MSCTFISGCVAELPASSYPPGIKEKTSIDASVAAWATAGLPWSDKCSEEYPRIRIVVSQPREFTDLCGRKPLHAGGRLYACQTEQFEFQFPARFIYWSKVPLLVVSALESPAHQHVLIIHETLHWLERCSGKGIDFDHSDAYVWTKVRGAARHIAFPKPDQTQRAEIRDTAPRLSESPVGPLRFHLGPEGTPRRATAP